MQTGIKMTSNTRTGQIKTEAIQGLQRQNYLNIQFDYKRDIHQEGALSTLACN